MKIFEITDPTLNPDILNNALDAVANDCHRYLDEVGGLHVALRDRPLYRGVNKVFFSEAPMVVAPVPVNRRPKDTPLETHQQVDNWFLQHFKIRYRSNAFFVTGGRNTASQYGSLAVLVPIGDYSYCWSPVIDDFYIQLKSDSNVVEMLDNADYQTTDIKKALKVGHEIMLHCEKAYLIEYTFAQAMAEQL